MPTVAQTNKLECKVLVRLTEEMWERIQIYAIKRRTSVQAVCFEGIEQYLERINKPEHQPAA